VTKDIRAILADRFLDEMVQGYLDGRLPENPPPSTNRSASYRHGFENGRDDLFHSPRDLAQTLRELADKAIAEDVEKSLEGGSPSDADLPLWKTGGSPGRTSVGRGSLEIIIATSKRPRR
jgi:hypothetical protein